MTASRHYKTRESGVRLKLVCTVQAVCDSCLVVDVVMCGITLPAAAAATEIDIH